MATIISQSISLLWQLKLFSNKNDVIYFRRDSFKMRGRIIRDTISIGMPQFMMNMAACLVVLLIKPRCRLELLHYIYKASTIGNSFKYIF